MFRADAAITETYAHAEQERAAAHEAHRAGDEVAAGLHAEHAVAAYGHALVVARVARATIELAEAQKSLDDATASLASIEGSRANLEREGDELDRRLRLARERLLPAPSARATAEREAARAVAARSLSMEARLLCGAARLVAPVAPGLAEAAADAARLDDAPPSTEGVRRAAPPIDDAARARAHCLDVLTLARRARGVDVGAADLLLTELSAAGGWDPGRDERGVVVTLHDAFRGADLTKDASAKLHELGRVASAHQDYGVQVVVHAAQLAAAKDTTDAKRADAAIEALVAGGAATGRIKAELAGVRTPLVEPTDARARARNERLDVVFVAGGR